MWKLLVPAFRSRDNYDWNAEKWGDIAESMLAVGLGVVQFDTAAVDVHCRVINVAWVATEIDKLSCWVFSVYAHFPAHYDVPSIKRLYRLAKNEAVRIHGKWPADSNWPADVPRRYNVW